MHIQDNVREALENSGFSIEDHTDEENVGFSIARKGDQILQIYEMKEVKATSLEAVIAEHLDQPLYK